MSLNRESVGRQKDREIDEQEAEIIAETLGKNKRCQLNHIRLIGKNKSIPPPTGTRVGKVCVWKNATIKYVIINVIPDHILKVYAFTSSPTSGFNFFHVNVGFSLNYRNGNINFNYLRVTWTELDRMNYSVAVWSSSVIWSLCKGSMVFGPSRTQWID
ncbi:12734_t:CDS:2 [Ambispora gerdemannii]|uniref:12734_t:CDS:1 n=1 Tax=Ambispora gerdemannii TaxID=144530 RepID=A0A9N9FSL5_9GLOM|nr:12734_t:CDS:2 [Ambispora gerdemannii]